MMWKKAHNDETDTTLAARESEHWTAPEPAHSLHAWIRLLMTVMTFLLGLTVIIDSAALIGHA